MTDSIAYQTFRGNLRTLMEKCGMTQREMCDLAGIYPADLSRILTGKSEPRLSTAQKIAQTLGVRVADLLDEKLDIDSIKPDKISA